MSKRGTGGKVLGWIETCKSKASSFITKVVVPRNFGVSTLSTVLHHYTVHRPTLSMKGIVIEQHTLGVRIPKSQSHI